MFENGANAVRLTHDIHVVKIGEEVFVKRQEILKRKQSAMLSEGVQHGHESIALLTPFALVDHMGVTDSLTSYEPNDTVVNELVNSQGSFSNVTPSSDLDTDDTTLGKLLTETHREHADHRSPGKCVR